MNEQAIRQILAESLSMLPAGDRAERIEWCQRTGQHGVRAFPDPDGIRFEWGGRPLAVVPVEAFSDESMLRVDLLPAAPDDASTIGDLS